MRRALLFAIFVLCVSGSPLLGQDAPVQISLHTDGRIAAIAEVGSTAAALDLLAFSAPEASVAFAREGVSDDDVRAVTAGVRERGIGRMWLVGPRLLVASPVPGAPAGWSVIRGTDGTGFRIELSHLAEESVEGFARTAGHESVELLAARDVTFGRVAGLQRALVRAGVTNVVLRVLDPSGG